MTSGKYSSAPGVIFALGLIFTVFGLPAFADTYTWTGAGGPNWSTSANWSNNSLPGIADIAYFASSSSYANQPTVDSSQNVGALWDTGSAGLAIGSGGILTLYGATVSSNTGTGIQMDSTAGSLTINADVGLASAQTWYNNSGNLLALTGSVDNGGNMLTFAGSGNSLFTGTLSGTGGVTVTGGSVTMLGSGAKYSGNTTVTGGTLQMNVNGANGWYTGAGTMALNIGLGGMVRVYSDTSVVAGNETGVVNGLLGTSAGSLTITGSGVFQKIGNGLLATELSNAGKGINFAMSPGGLIDIENGRLRNGGWSTVNWTNNQASMYIGTGGTMDVWDGQAVHIDSLSGGSGGFVTIGITNGTTRIFNVGEENGSGVFAGTIMNGSGVISLAKSGTGLEVLSGSNTYTGATIISGGTLQLGNFGATGSLSTSSAITINNNATFALALSRSNAVTQGVDFSSGALNGTGGLAQIGVGNLILNQTNGYTGPTLIRGGGTISISAISNIGNASPTTLDGGVLEFTNTAGFNNARNWTATLNGGTISVNGGTSTLSGTVAGPGVITFASTSTKVGVFVLSNTANSQSGTRLINTILPFDSARELGPAPNTPGFNLYLNNGQLVSTGGPRSLSVNRAVQVNGMGYLESSSGAFTLNGGVNDGVVGGLGVVWDAGTVVLNGLSGYGGATIIGTTGLGSYNHGVSTATLQLGGSGGLPSGTYVSFGVHPNLASNLAILDLGGHSVTVGGLSSGTNAVVENSSGVATLTISGSGGVFTGALSSTLGGINLIMNGIGAQGIGAGTSLNSLQVNSSVLNVNGNGNINVGQFSGSGGTISSSVAGVPVMVVNNSVPSTFSGKIVNGGGGSTPGLNLASGNLTLLNGIASDGPVSVGGGALLTMGSAASLGGSVGGALTLGSGVSGGTLALGAGTSTVGGLFSGGSSTASAIIEGYPSGAATLRVNYNGGVTSVFNGAIGGSGSNQNNIAMSFIGNGQVNLAGSETYTGATTVVNGTLGVTGQIANSNVSVSPNGTVVGTGLIRGNVITAGSGSTIGLLAGSGTFSVNGNVSLGASNTNLIGGASTLTYVPGVSGVEMLSAGTVSLVNSGSGSDIVSLPDSISLGNNFLPTGTYTLIKAGTINFGNNKFVLDVQGRTSKLVVNKFLNYALTQTGTSLTLTVSGNNAPPVAYLSFRANTSNLVWSDVDTTIPPTAVINWTTDVNGNNMAPMLPGPKTDVVLYANDGSVDTTSALGGGSWIINTLNTNQSNTGHTITDDGSTMTILAGTNSVGKPSGTGISVAGTGPLAVNIPLFVGASQVWSTSGGGDLTVNGINGTAGAGSQQTLTLANAGAGGTTVSGVVSDGFNGGSLALSMSSVGAGVTTLSSSNSYSGGTTLWTGNVVLGDPHALGSGGVTVTGGQLDLNGNSAIVSALNGLGGTVTNNGVAASLNVSAGTYGGTLSNGSGTLGLVKTGAGIQVLSGISTYTGATTINGGRLFIDGTIASAATVNSSGTLSGSGQLASVLVNAFGHLAPGDLNASGLALSGILDIEGGALDIFGASSLASSVSIGGNMILNNSPALDFSGNLSNGTYTIASYNGTESGTFGTLNLPTGYTIDYGTGSNSAITLMVSAVGPVTNIWNNTGTVWSVGTNWNSAVPGSSDTALFNLAAYTNQPTLSTSASVGALWSTGAGSVAVSGSTLTINSALVNGNASTGIEMDSSAGSLTISSALLLGGSQTWLNNSHSPLTVSGAVANGGNRLTIAGSGNTLISGNVSGAGGLVKTSGGTLTLSGTNSYNGGTFVSGGELILTNAKAIQDGSKLVVGNPAAFGIVLAPIADSSPVVSAAAVVNAPVAPVPEPGTLALLAAGAAVIVTVARRRRRSRRQDD